MSVHRGIVDAISVLKIEIFLYYYDPHTDPPPSTMLPTMLLSLGEAAPGIVRTLWRAQQVRRAVDTS